MPMLKSRPFSPSNGMDDIKKKIERYESDLSYFESNQARLVTEYNENWVAILNSEVVAHSKNYLDLVGKLLKMGLPEDQLAIKYLSDKEIIALYFCR